MLFKVITSQPLEDIRDIKENEKVDEEESEFGNTTTVEDKKKLPADELLHQRISSTL